MIEEKDYLEPKKKASKTRLGLIEEALQIQNDFTVIVSEVRLVKNVFGRLFPRFRSPQPPTHYETMRLMRMFGQVADVSHMKRRGAIEGAQQLQQGVRTEPMFRFENDDNRLKYRLNHYMLVKFLPQNFDYSRFYLPDVNQANLNLPVNQYLENNKRKYRDAYRYTSDLPFRYPTRKTQLINSNEDPTKTADWNQQNKEIHDTGFLIRSLDLENENDLFISPSQYNEEDYLYLESKINRYHEPGVPEKGKENDIIKRYFCVLNILDQRLPISSDELTFWKTFHQYFNELPQQTHNNFTQIFNEYEKNKHQWFRVLTNAVGKTTYGERPTDHLIERKIQYYESITYDYHQHSSSVFKAMFKTILQVIVSILFPVFAKPAITSLTSTFTDLQGFSPQNFVKRNRGQSTPSYRNELFRSGNNYERYLRRWGVSYAHVQAAFRRWAYESWWYTYVSGTSWTWGRNRRGILVEMMGRIDAYFTHYTHFKVYNGYLRRKRNNDVTVFEILQVREYALEFFRGEHTDRTGVIRECDRIMKNLPFKPGFFQNDIALVHKIVNRVPEVNNKEYTDNVKKNGENHWLSKRMKQIDPNIKNLDKPPVLTIDFSNIQRDDSARDSIAPETGKDQPSRPPKTPNLTTEKPLFSKAKINLYTVIPLTLAGLGMILTGSTKKDE